MVEITESAKNKIIDLLIEENNPKLMLRTFVQGGGCSGFQYGFTFDDVVNEDDFEFPLDDKFKVVIDAMSMQYMTGAEIDYKEDVMGSQFAIKNPNAQTTPTVMSLKTLCLLGTWPPPTWGRVLAHRSAYPPRQAPSPRRSALP